MIDRNSYELNEVLPLKYVAIKQRVHGNVKNSHSLRGLGIYNIIDNYERMGGLGYFYQSYPDIKHTMQAIRTLEVDYRQKYYALLYRQVGKHYQLHIKHEITKYRRAS